MKCIGYDEDAELEKHNFHMENDGKRGRERERFT